MASINDLIELDHTTERHDDGDVKATNDADQERATLAMTETKIVARMEYVLFLVLLLTSVLVSVGVYDYSRSNQVKAFRNSFNADAEKLLEAFYKTVESQLEAVDALSVQITSHAEDTGAKFPFLSLPNFGVKFANSRAMSGSFMIGYYPLVTDETKVQWETYASDNSRRFDEALALEIRLRKRQDAYFNYSDGSELMGSREASEQIMRLDSDGFIKPIAPPQSGPYLPVFHISPVPPDKALLNFDTLSHPSFAGAHLETITNGRAVIDVMTTAEAENLRGTEIFYTMLLALSQYRSKDAAEAYQGDPMSAFAYPVFDSFDMDTRKVAGVVSSQIYWQLSFKNVLPKDTRGIYCILENTKNQTYTYLIDHGKVSFVGEGDHHDKRYDDFERSVDIASAEANHTTLETKSFTSVDLDAEYCNYKLRVYPSAKTEAQHVNGDPLRAMIVIVGVFLVSSITFVFYAWAVRRRQRIVMNRALASGAIVSSLFPTQVRDQIYQENETEKHKKPWFANADDKVGSGTEGGTTRPIATVFEATTVMFADMAGFTRWSSTRTPAQVFEMLETVYQAFDTIAERRKVFKVETIGDCYVAVAGLPDPQEDHALIMVKFAAACLQKMSELLTDLASSLGPDTANLAMRIGMHSGPVTGGVLRGQKSRFQLFGDTMNTAARMETNGTPGRIQASLETATELIAKGKSAWVSPRDDRIVAKGKGELQTYWVCVRSLARSVDCIDFPNSTGRGGPNRERLQPNCRATTHELHGRGQTCGIVDSVET